MNEWEESEVLTDGGKILISIRAEVTPPKKKLVSIMHRKRPLPSKKPSLSFYLRISYGNEDDTFQVVLGLTALPEKAITDWLISRELSEYVEQTINSIKALLDCLGEKIAKQKGINS